MAFSLRGPVRVGGLDKPRPLRKKHSIAVSNLQVESEKEIQPQDIAEGVENAEVNQVVPAFKGKVSALAKSVSCKANESKGHSYHPWNVLSRNNTINDESRLIVPDSVLTDMNENQMPKQPGMIKKEMKMIKEDLSVWRDSLHTFSQQSSVDKACHLSSVQSSMESFSLQNPAENIGSRAEQPSNDGDNLHSQIKWTDSRTSRSPFRSFLSHQTALDSASNGPFHSVGEQSKGHANIDEKRLTAFHRSLSDPFDRAVGTIQESKSLPHPPSLTGSLMQNKMKFSQDNVNFGWHKKGFLQSSTPCPDEEQVGQEHRSHSQEGSSSLLSSLGSYSTSLTQIDRMKELKYIKCKVVLNNIEEEITLLTLHAKTLTMALSFLQQGMDAKVVSTGQGTEEIIEEMGCQLGVSLSPVQLAELPSKGQYSAEKLVSLSTCPFSRTRPFNWEVFVQKFPYCCLPKVKEYFKPSDWKISVKHPCGYFLPQKDLDDNVIYNN